MVVSASYRSPGLMSGPSPRLPIFSPTVISFQNSGYPNKLSGRRQRHQIKTATNINTPPSPHSPLPTLVLGSTGGLFVPLVCSHLRFCKFCIVDRLDAGYCRVVVSAHCIITRPGSRQTNKIKLHLCNNTINTGRPAGDRQEDSISRDEDNIDKSMVQRIATQ